jgi:glucuronoarabinoxylan endo-1,4-beta-xylanase
MIHDHLVVGEVSAWHYWWLKYATPDNGALMNGGQLTRRAYTLGNWSRFVRPGFVRVEATPNPQYGVFVSAFVNPDPASNRLVIVTINQGSVDVEQVFSISGSVLPAAVTPWITSADLALAPAPAVPVTDAAFTFTLLGRSVTTFVGDP